MISLGLWEVKKGKVSLRKENLKFWEENDFEGPSMMKIGVESE